MWMGRSPEGGQVRLTKMEDIGKLALQLPAMLVGLQFVNVNVNNLYAWPEHVKKASAKAGGAIKVCVIAPV